MSKIKFTGRYHHALLLFQAVYLVMKQKIDADLVHNNNELASILLNISKCYAYMGKPEHFRAIAYAQASKTILNMSESVCKYANDLKKLELMKGVGKHIAEKIREYCMTGQIKQMRELAAMCPMDLMELSKTKGIGPVTIKTLHDFYHITTRSALKKRLNISNHPPGIGLKKILSIKHVLTQLKYDQKKHALVDILPVAKDLKKYLEGISHVMEVRIAGSIRRKKPWILDIDIIVVCEKKYKKQIASDILHYNRIKDVLWKGVTKIGMILDYPPIQCDLRLFEPASIGAALLYMTGTKEHAIQLRKIAKSFGYKLNEYGLFDSCGIKLAGRTETEIYNRLGLSFIPPEERQGLQEISNAKLTTRKAEPYSCVI